MRTINLPVVLALMLSLLWSATTTAQEQQKTSQLKELTGKVVDGAGNPIKEFEVSIGIYDYTESGFNKRPETLKELKGEFKNGEFRFEVTEPIESNDMTYVSRTVTAEGYLELNQSGFELLSTFNGKFRDTTLSRGIKIKGKVVLPHGNTNEPLISPYLKVAKEIREMADFNNYFERHLPLGEDGSFEQVIPEGIPICLVASAANAGATFKKVEVPIRDSDEHVFDLGKIELSDGVRLRGRVLDRNQQPVAGQVVQIRQLVHKSRLSAHHIYGCAVSDEEGKFELPPREGKCDITLANRGVINGQTVFPKGNLLITKPVKVDVKRGEPQKEVVIRESKTWRVHGTIASDVGAPTMTARISAGNQIEVKIDEKGNFEFEVAHGSTPNLFIYKLHGDSWYEAQISSTALRRFGKHFDRSPATASQFFSLKDVKSDIGPLDFQMVKHWRDERSTMDRFIDWYFYGDE